MVIEVEETTKWCNSCMNEHGNYSVRVGLNDNQTSSLSFCAKCRQELVLKLTAINETQ